MSLPKDLAQELKNSGLSGRYTIKLSLYIEVVQYIVDKGASIPPEVIRILKRCISLRRRASLQFAPTRESEASDKSHQYFIGILVKICGIFERNTSTLDSSEPISIRNQFTELSSDESEENAEDVPDIDIPRVAFSIPNMSFEPEMVVMEAISAMVMFLGDMERVRGDLEGLWKDYKSGKIDLITASVTTNTAIEILQRPHDQLMKRIMPVFGNDFQKMITMTFGLLRGLKTGDTDIPNFDLVDDQDTKSEKMYDFLMLPLAQMFGDLLDNLPNSIPSVASPCKSDRYETYDPNALFDKLPCRARWQQYQILLSDVFSDISVLLGHAMGSVPQDNSIFDVDSVVCLMDRFIRTKEISFHLTFAMRIYMDINFILGAEAARGPQYLNETAERMIENLKQRPSVQGDVPHKKWNTRHDQMVGRLLAELGILECASAFGITDSLLFRHPVLCGLYVFRLQIIYQDTGLTLANMFASIQSAAHLYQACQLSNQGKHGRKQVEWPDMDLVLRLHGTEQIFGVKVPRTVRESLKAFQHIAVFTTGTINGQHSVHTGLACGCSDKAGLEGLECISDHASIQDQTSILPIFKHRITESFSPAVHEDMTAIEALLRDLKAREDRHLGSTNIFRKEKKHRAAKFSIIQLLSVLEEGLQLETTSIRFDYVPMHLRCMRIFRDMKQICDPLMAAIHRDVFDRFGRWVPGEPYIRNDTMLPAITGYIINFVDQYQGKLVTGMSPNPGRLLIRASDVLRRILETEEAGREETLKVEDDRKK
jgi:hypothetical protein